MKIIVNAAIGSLVSSKRAQLARLEGEIDALELIGSGRVPPLGSLLGMVPGIEGQPAATVYWLGLLLEWYRSGSGPVDAPALDAAIVRVWAVAAGEGDGN